MAIPRDQFVNPYTYVPLPPTVVRLPAPEHRATAGTWSGTIDVEWTTLSPLLLPADARRQGWLDADRVVVPGSSVKGSVRSLHETLFNGCLRVFDEDFLPAYREPADASGTDEAQGWTLAVVTRSRDGVPLDVTPCDDVAFVDAVDLASKLSSPPTSGDVLDLDAAWEPSNVRNGRNEARVLHRAESRGALASRASGPERMCDPPHPQDWVVLVTSVSARKRTTRDGRPARCYWAVGRVPEQAGSVAVPEEVATAFAQTCDQAKDLQELRSGEKSGKVPKDWRSATPTEWVEWAHQRVGSRRLVTGRLHAGDVVWVRQERGAVTEIKLSQIWRRLGGGKAGARVADVKACRSHEALCLTCAIFGSADTSGQERGKGDQGAYGGHVRFGAAMSIETVRSQSIELAPTGSPHLGAGGFSLEKRAADRDRPPHDVAAHWGEALDYPRPTGAPEWRMLRGRKYYWHSDPDAQARAWGDELGRRVEPRYIATQHHSRGQVRTAELVPAGTVLRQRIAVDAIDGFALATLLAALVPRDFLRQLPGQEGVEAASHLGGGKPFGLGSAHATVRGAELWEGGGRYTGQEPTRTASSLDLRRDVTKLRDRCGSISHLMAAARVLDRRGLGDDEVLVSYPPAATWDRIGTREFGESFRFFQASSGEQLANGRATQWRTLPSPTDAAGGRSDQTLPIVERKRRP